MNIAYIVNARIPTEKAHGLQIVRVCDALAKLGHTVKLVVPRCKNAITADTFSYYGIKSTFTVETVPVLSASFKARASTFILALLNHTFTRDTVIITRNPEIAFLFVCRRYKVFYYAHNWPQSKLWFFKRLLRNVAGVICNSRGTESEFVANGFTNTIVVPNAVDTSAFDSLPDKRSLRSDLDIPADKKVVMYVGHLYEWKGVNVIVDAAEALMKKSDILFYVVGGTDSDISSYRSIVAQRGLSNIVFVGHKRHDEVPSYLKSADVLLLPNVSSSKESERYTSPIKMFEYMTSGVPIIASDLPSIREILSDDMATLIPAGDSGALATAVEMITSDPTTAEAKAATAALQAKKYSWDELARSISPFIGGK